MVNKMIRCPECGATGTFSVGITGTATAFVRNGRLYFKNPRYQVDEKDVFECQYCDFFTRDMNEFFVKRSPFPQWMHDLPASDCGG